MSMPSSEEINRIRTDIEASVLPDTCMILSPTNTPDGQGNYAIGWGTVVASVACRIDPVRVGEELIGEGLREDFEFVLTVPQGTDIELDYRIVHNGTTYNVTGTKAGGSWEAHGRALLKKVI